MDGRADVRPLRPWHPVVLRRTWSRHRAGAVLAVVALAVVAALTLRASLAAFQFSTSTGQNSWQAGRVQLSSSGTGTAVFDVDGMLPGDAVTRCVQVSYTGDLEAQVRLYLTGTSGPGSLAEHLDIGVQTGTGSDPSCADFAGATTALATTRLSAAAAAHTGHASGIDTWQPTAAATRTYRITVTLPADADDAAQGLVAATTFVWEARSL